MNDRKLISRRRIEEGYGHGNAETMTELMSPHLLEETLIREQIAASRAAFPDLTATVEEQIAQGDRVVTRFTYRGHQTGFLVGIAPTGKAVEITVVEFHTIQDGKIVEWWNDFRPLDIAQ